MATDNVTLVREFIAALDRWDFDAMRERLHPERFTYRIPYSPEWIPSELSGGDTSLDFARALRDASASAQPARPSEAPLFPSVSVRTLRRCLEILAEAGRC